jgi:hypothetical protein
MSYRYHLFILRIPGVGNSRHELCGLFYIVMLVQVLPMSVFTLGSLF